MLSNKCWACKEGARRGETEIGKGDKKKEKGPDGEVGEGERERKERVMGAGGFHTSN